MKYVIVITIILWCLFNIFTGPNEIDLMKQDAQEHENIRIELAKQYDLQQYKEIK